MVAKLNTAVTYHDILTLTMDKLKLLPALANIGNAVNYSGIF